LQFRKESIAVSLAVKQCLKGARKRPPEKMKPRRKLISGSACDAAVKWQLWTVMEANEFLLIGLKPGAAKTRRQIPASALEWIG
jgi:hypothetical protein